MTFRNTFFGTYPSVLHQPSKSPLWNVIVKEFFRSTPRKIRLRDDLTIVTWNSRPKESLLERSLNHLGLPCMVLGKGIDPWDNTMKIDLTRDFLSQVGTKFVLGIDAFDAIVVRDPNSAVDLLSDYGAEMVFNATCGTAFSSERLIEFCNTEYAGYPMRHLNAGAWIAKVGCCQHLFDLASEVTDEEASEVSEPPWDTQSEQVRVKLVFEKLYPRVSIDYRCKFFQLINDAWCGLGANQGVEVVKTCM